MAARLAPPRKPDSCARLGGGFVRPAVRIVERFHEGKHPQDGFDHRDGLIEVDPMAAIGHHAVLPNQRPLRVGVMFRHRVRSGGFRAQHRERHMGGKCRWIKLGNALRKIFQM